jgi:hypothetical protein
MPPATIHVATDLDAPADRVWEAMRLPATFLHVCRGLFRVPALEGRIDPIVEGETGSGWLLAFGVVPAYRHTIEVERVDPADRTIATHEHGGVLRRWDHVLHVEPDPEDPGRSRYSDSVTIDAGRLTPLVARMAVGIYRYRQHRWRALARRHLSQPAGAAGPQHV